MPNPYNGTGSALGAPPAVTIKGSTNTNPVIVETTSAHGLLDGDAVWIYDHQVNHVINGENYITLVDATHFSVPAAGVGVGVTTGTVQSLAFNPSSANLISDGVDNLDAGNLNPPVEHALDRTALLQAFAKSLVTYGPSPVRAYQIANHKDTTLTQNGTASMNGTEVELTNSRFTIGKLNQNQLVIWLVSTNVAGTGTAQIAPAFVCYEPGGTPGALTSLTYLACDATIRGQTLVGATVFTGFTGGNLDVALIGYSAGIGTAAFYGSYCVHALVLG